MDYNKFIETVNNSRNRATSSSTTTSGQLELEDEDHMQHVIDLKPEMASYDCGSMNGCTASWEQPALWRNWAQF